LREIDVSTITEAVAKLCMEANYNLPQDVYCALQRAQKNEASPVCKDALTCILQNADIAKREQVPICQDTGLAVIFMEVGQEVHFMGGSLEEAVNRGVSQGYTKGYLRKSALADPLFERKNTGDNTPAMLNVRIVPGDQVVITVAPKGGGSENMSALGMLKPADGLEGVKKFIVETVKKAGSNPCPPVIVGVGIGGTIEKTTLAAKHALLRSLDEVNPDEKVATFEKEVLEEINKLGIGAQGFGGTLTALAVHIELVEVAHLASLPVAVNLQCHVARHQQIVL